MTGRARTLIFLAAAGMVIGILRRQNVLSVMSLSVLVWIFVEWLVFSWRVHFQLPALRCSRTVNGRAERDGVLWAGRTATIQVTTTSRSRNVMPMLMVAEILPENLKLTDGQSTGHVFDAVTSLQFQYRCEVLAPGKIVFTGYFIRYQDLHALFVVERFIDCRQTFRVLPAYADIREGHPVIKRINSLPQHGIHRLQRAGMGSELLELREYVPGDPPKSIAWKVSARRDVLMTRQYETEVPVRVQLFVDNSIGTQLGGFGSRLIDQMTFVAGTVARSSISVGDPVGMVTFDDSGFSWIPAVGGERGFYRILDALTEAATLTKPPVQSLTIRLQNAAWLVCSKRYPELLHPVINQTPFTWLPVLPWNRHARHRRTQLASIFGQIYELPPPEVIQLVHDDLQMGTYCQRLLHESGWAWIDPVVSGRERGFHHCLGKLPPLSQALTRVVARAKDHEVYVILADLLDCAQQLDALIPALRLAIAKHHRVVVICPSPIFERPVEAFGANSLELPELLREAERIRVTALAGQLKRAIRRLGATVSFSGEQNAVRLILSEVSLARTGRTAAVGAR